MGSRFAGHETWTRTDHHVVHAYLTGPVAERSLPDGPIVVLVPGLGLPEYLGPTVQHLSADGAFCAILDLPGFRARGRHGSRPDVEAVGRAAAEWVQAHRFTGPCVVFGHSTGSQGALAAALRLQKTTDRLCVVLAGPTFTPAQRRLLPLAAASVTAYRKDSLAELVVLPTALRNAPGVAAILRSGMRDVPESRISALRASVTLTAGEADSFAPRFWLERLAEAAAPRSSAQAVVLPGSHNNPFTHPSQVAHVVLAARRMHADSLVRRCFSLDRLGHQRGRGRRADRRPMFLQQGEPHDHPGDQVHPGERAREPGVQPVDPVRGVPPVHGRRPERDAA